MREMLKILCFHFEHLYPAEHKLKKYQRKKTFFRFSVKAIFNTNIFHEKSLLNQAGTNKNPDGRGIW